MELGVYSVKDGITIGNKDILLTTMLVAGPYLQVSAYYQLMQATHHYGRYLRHDGICHLADNRAVDKGSVSDFELGEAGVGIDKTDSSVCGSG